MRGFTLIEVIVVIAIFSVVILLGLFMSMDTFRGTIYRSEQDSIVSVLQKARSRSLANIHQTPWSVCYSAHTYVLFQGTLCIPGASSNEEIPAHAASTVTFLSPIIFSQLSATTTGGTITVMQEGRASTITVNPAGTIDW